MKAKRIDNLEYLVLDVSKFETEYPRLQEEHLTPVIIGMRDIEPLDAEVKVKYLRSKKKGSSVRLWWTKDVQVAVEKPFPTVDKAVVLSAAKELGAIIQANLLKQAGKLN